MADASLRAGVVRGRPALFAAGLAVTAVALFPPVDAAALRSLTAHMVQHVLLIAVAAPLLGAGLPSSGAGRRRWWWPVGALAAQAVVMWCWHAPVLYDAALLHEPLHAAEHACLLSTATAFWWAVDVRRPTGGAVALVFAAALPGTALGAAMTFAASPWYSLYPSLADQQLAGVVMWAYAGLAYVIAGAVMFGVWLAGTERQAAL